jgi:antitoxin CptB
MPSIDVRRRRAQYRASHRGTRELDWLLGKYADATVPAMLAAELEAFERLLAMPDPDLHAWIALGVDVGQSEFGPMIGTIRQFHGLDRTT